MRGSRRASISAPRGGRRAGGASPPPPAEPPARTLPGYRRPGPAAAARGGLAFLLVLLLAGCLLSTRDGEEPGENGDVYVWVPPVTLGNALGNMARSLEAGVLTNYGNSFSDDGLEMELDPADLAELGQNEFDEWSAAQEEERMAGILNSTEATLEVFWVPEDSIDQSASVRYYEDLAYRLEFSEPTRAVTYSGKVDLWFEDDGTGEWYITKWIDKRDGSPNRTWGWLRARNQVEFQGGEGRPASTGSGRGPKSAAREGGEARRWRKLDRFRRGSI
jgi:hypothetical protein